MKIIAVLFVTAQIFESRIDMALIPVTETT
jgi:hypothetical protein